jgi:zinc protease
VTRAPILALLLVACGASRTPLPPPAAAMSWVPALPAPAERDAELAAPSVPAIVAFELPNGLDVQIVELRGVPVVYTALVGRGGGDRDAPPELDALLELALGGTGTGESDGLTGGRVSDRGVVLVSRVVPADFPQAILRHSAMLDHRGVGYTDIARARTALLGRVRFERSRRARRSSVPPEEDLLARLYGDDHPRVVRTRMRPSVLERIDVERVHQHLSRLLRPSQSTLIVVGDVEAGAAEQMIRERFASIPSPEAEPEARRPPPAFPDPATRLRIHPTQDQPNAVVRLIERGPPVGHADYPAFRLFATLAGGMFSSRLNLRLRETRGDTYGVMTSVSDRDDHSLLEITIIVPVRAAGTAASAIVEELARLSDASQIDDEELRIARSVALAELDASLETSTGLGVALVGAALAGEPPSSIATRFAQLGALDAESIAAMARRWVRVERAPMIVIGDGIWLFTHPVRVPGGVEIVGM